MASPAGCIGLCKNALVQVGWVHKFHPPRATLSVV